MSYRSINNNTSLQLCQQLCEAALVLYFSISLREDF